MILPSGFAITDIPGFSHSSDSDSPGDMKIRISVELAGVTCLQAAGRSVERRSGNQVLTQELELDRYGFIETRAGVVKQSKVAVGDVVEAFRIGHQVERFSSDLIVRVDHLVLR